MSQLQESAGQALGEKAGPSLSKSCRPGFPPGAGGGSRTGRVRGGLAAGKPGRLGDAGGDEASKVLSRPPQPGLCRAGLLQLLKAARLGSAAGLLKEEMDRLGLPVVPAPEPRRWRPAAALLAVDRDRFPPWSLKNPRPSQHPGGVPGGNRPAGRVRPVGRPSWPPDP